VSAGPAGPGPHLVYDADAPSRPVTPAPAEPPRSRRPWLVALLVVATLLAGFEWRRATALETRVEALSAALATAQAEIAARRQQLDAIRASVDDVRARVAGLASLAAEEPNPASIAPAKPAPDR